MKKGAYSKWLIAMIVLLNVAFAFGVLWAMKGGASEPVTLIKEWFKWTTIELGASAGVKMTKVIVDGVKNIIANTKKKTDSDEQPEEKE